MDEKNNTHDQGQATVAENYSETEPAYPPSSLSNEKQFGPLVGIIIIIAILLLGGLYFWGQRIATERGERVAPAEEILAEPDTALEALGQQNTSDEIGVIEADIQSTDLEGLGAELQQIESELGF